MACYRYIELPPVRAGMTTDPADDRGSSHSHNASGRQNPRITPHQDYLRLESMPAAWQAACRALLCEHLDEQQLAELRLHTRQRRAGATTASASRSER